MQMSCQMKKGGDAIIRQTLPKPNVADTQTHLRHQHEVSDEIVSESAFPDSSTAGFRCSTFVCWWVIKRWKLHSNNRRSCGILHRVDNVVDYDVRSVQKQYDWTARQPKKVGIDAPKQRR